MPLLWRSKGKKRDEPIYQGPVFTESILDLCPDIDISDVSLMPGLPGTPGYPIRMATPIPAGSTSTDANGVAHYPGAYVFAEPDPYLNPYPFTAADVEFDFSAREQEQSPVLRRLGYVLGYQ